MHKYGETQNAENILEMKYVIPEVLKIIWTNTWLLVAQLNPSSESFSATESWFWNIVPLKNCQ